MMASFSRQDLCNIIKDVKHDLRSRTLYDYLKNKTQLDDTEDKYKRKLLNYCSRFTFEYNKRWQCSQRNITNFKNKNSIWLKEIINIPVSSIISMDNVQRISNTNGIRPRGRPVKAFSNCTSRAKRYKIENLCSKYSTQELICAANCSSQKSSVPYKTDENRNIHSAECTHNLSPDQALTLLIEVGLSRAKYQKMREIMKVLPTYNKVREAKTQCYPENITVSEMSAEVTLQNLLNHTAKRLLIFLKEVIETLTPYQRSHIKVLYKCGCDGSGEHSLYKINFSAPDISDSHLFLLSVSPVQMFTEDDKGQKFVIWRNPHPSSPRFCRPFRFIFAKETSTLVQREMSYLDGQIKNLQEFFLPGLTVKHICQKTMVDGKISSILTQKSCQRCQICGAYPSEMNDIEYLSQVEPDESAYEFGLSVLHARIRFLECVLHIAYRLDFQEWIANGNNKIVLLARQNIIRDKLRTEMGILVDMPTSSGHGGSTNDGNTSRTFFKNPELASRITGVNKDLIQKFSTILSVLNARYDINVKAFDSYCKETAKLYVNLYPWYYMPSAVHKILFHGAAIIENGICPIGIMSEEAQESQHKDIRKYRRDFTRKCSREKCNDDLLRRLLLTSDPLISLSRKLPLKSAEAITSEVRNMLCEPHIPVSSLFPALPA